MTTGKLNPMANGTMRLSSATRDLAYRYLTGEYHARVREFPRKLSRTDFPPETPNSKIHAECAKMLAAESPLEIVPGELLAGSAPNLEALRHCVPGLPGQSSISHTTVDLHDAVNKGLSGLEAELRAVCPGANRKQQCFRESLLAVVSAMRIWIARYVKAYRDLASGDSDHQAFFTKIADRLERVPEYAPHCFSDALQSLWLFWEFQRLCGNWSGLGRIDWILGPYLRHDLDEGVITLDEAREELAHFWIKGTEWCYGLREDHAGKNDPYARSFGEGGDAQVYQNIILGGTAPDGTPLENEVTFLVLDVVEELHISDFPIAVRLNDRSSDRLCRRIAEVQLLGGGIVSIYNEALVLKGLEKFGYRHEEALNFTNDGCWEVIIPGRTRFSYIPFDMLQVFQKALFRTDVPDSFETLYARFREEMRVQAQDLRTQVKEKWRTYADGTGFCGDNDAVLSLLEPDCRQSLTSYTDFGTRYSVQAFHAGGLPDVANSLYAISKLVFGEKPQLSMAQMLDVLTSDYQGCEELRQRIASQLLCYGNDNPESDAMMQRVYQDYTEIFGAEKHVGKVLTPLGISTFGREIAYASKRMATAFGRHAGEYLAPNLSPTPGTERNPLTSVVNSYCKMDFTRVPNGCPLDLRLSAGIRKIPNAPDLLAHILRVFLAKGGFYLQLDTVDPAMLEAAKKDPDRFPNLVVRISGWSARFATLAENWQDMIIRRVALEIMER